jgi:hypothetical protein
LLDRGTAGGDSFFEAGDRKLHFETPEDVNWTEGTDWRRWE